MGGGREAVVSSGRRSAAWGRCWQGSGGRGQPGPTYNRCPSRQVIIHHPTKAEPTEKRVRENDALGIGGWDWVRDKEREGE